MIGTNIWIKDWHCRQDQIVLEPRKYIQHCVQFLVVVTYVAATQSPLACLYGDTYNLHQCHGDNGHSDT